VAIPELAEGRAPLARSAIEDAATALRSAWALDDAPIHDVVALAESNGAIVTRAEAESAAIDAFSKRIGGAGRPCIFLGTEKGSAARSRFDASHELGHQALHRNVPKRQLMTPAELKRIESEANAFAAAFLMPAASFADDLYLPTLDRMRAIKPRWRVSIAAMLHRASDLDIISDQHATRMWISLSRRGWKRQEPGDDVMPLERPTALARAFELVLEAGVQSAGQILERLSLSRREVEQLASLSTDMLGPEPARVRLRGPESEPSQPASEVGQLLPFRRPN
jgi:Zn-dependent peptidase ImmA (M78 family)